MMKDVSPSARKMNRKSHRDKPVSARQGAKSSTRPDARKGSRDGARGPRKPTADRGAARVSEATPAAVSVRMVTVDEDQAGQRLDNFLRVVLKGVPKTHVYRIIRKGEVRVNKGRAKAETKLAAGDVVRVPPVRVSEAKAPVVPGMQVAQQIESAILYEDDALLVLNKPSGLAVHGGSGVSLGVIEALRQLRPDCRFLELVHRIDRDTSGCLLIAKKRSLLRHLHAQIREHHMLKVYNALVDGRWPARKELVDAPLQKNILQSGERMVTVHPEGKRSKTRFRVMERYQDATLVEASLETGRTHQIRVHTQHTGHPILGDVKYGYEQTRELAEKVGLDRLFLHARKVGVNLPDGSYREFEAPLPAELVKVLDGMAR
ncbi:23S rRNA pseudouridine(955/2504/2580) synthase RluC [Parendozoicomonas haliclonae]|uniref:Pseudouridine synthase n=1 Tax=Parendozoicomonas haliclonae TaxID=1960125 RepID=A0A1X7AM35_9GAMM|nr:23S rRNA pseudouridine(955/2504/2580) synthase RluC [Parendozoicomonas haliclonae]SMA49174.1 Ribosomal large subunit pseudouridine synthase C [Parendozoicomonas haliclonae]